MAIETKIWDFPQLSISSQLFHVPGQTFEGGFTSGGAKISSPEPGGRAFLQMRCSFRDKEWEAPLLSWLMSRVNGDVFRIRLTATPQLAVKSAFNVFPGGQPWDNNQPWDNGQPWDNSGVNPTAAAIALEGELNIQVDMSLFGRIFKHGHVIGHGDHSYLIHDIRYVGNIAYITVTPPLRKDVEINDTILIQPFFLGQISNGEQFRATYDAANVGGIQTGQIIMTEVIL